MNLALITFSLFFSGLSSSWYHKQLKACKNQPAQRLIPSSLLSYESLEKNSWLYLPSASCQDPPRSQAHQLYLRGFKFLRAGDETLISQLNWAVPISSSPPGDHFPQGGDKLLFWTEAWAVMDAT